MARRIQIDYALRHQEVELLRAAMGALGSRFGRVALKALLETCQELRLPPPTLPTYPLRVILYGIASGRSGDIQDWYPSLEEAEAVLAGILRNEPDWVGLLYLEEVELAADACRN